MRDRVETPEDLLGYLRDEEGVDAFLADDECAGCRVIVAEVDGLRQVWHESDCEVMARTRESAGEPRGDGTLRERSEWTTWERGLRMGHVYASSYGEATEDAQFPWGSLHGLKSLAAGEIPEELHSRIMGFLVQPDDIGDPSQFWAGFSHGVAAFLVEQGIMAATDTDGP